MPRYGVFEIVGEKNLIQTVDRLEHALQSNKEGAQAWAEQVEDALADVERQMKQHRSEWYSADSPYQAVDLTRPTLARKLTGLRQAFSTTLFKAISLREKFEHITANLLAPAQANTEADAARPIDQAKDQGRALLEQLRACQNKENELIIESNCTDLGAGD